MAYNINLLGTKQQAIRIALNLREQGRGPGKEGKLEKVKGIGWYVDEYNMAQISFNLLDFDVTPVHVAYESVVEEAKELGLAVVGSEIVGLVPKQALMQAADYYLEREGLFVRGWCSSVVFENINFFPHFLVSPLAILPLEFKIDYDANSSTNARTQVPDEGQRVRLAIERLGLNSCSAFKPEERVIEYMCKDDSEEPLASLSVRDFVEELGARSAAPGGGSAAAVCASMGSGLGAMVGWMTYV